MIGPFYQPVRPAQAGADRPRGKKRAASRHLSLNASALPGFRCPDATQGAGPPSRGHLHSCDTVRFPAP